LPTFAAFLPQAPSLGMAEESTQSRLPGDPAEAECRTITFSTQSPRMAFTARYDPAVSAAQHYLDIWDVIPAQSWGFHLVPVVHLRSARRPEEELRLTFPPPWFEMGDEQDPGFLQYLPPYLEEHLSLDITAKLQFLIRRCARGEPHSPEDRVRGVLTGEGWNPGWGDNPPPPSLRPDCAALVAEYFDTLPPEKSLRLVLLACKALYTIGYRYW
jgi:hypothetical protein